MQKAPRDPLQATRPRRPRRPLWTLAGVLILSPLAGCAPQDLSMPTDPATEIARPVPPTPIGVASMLADGTIVMTLRATGAGGTVGDGQVTYEPTHAEYATVRDHLGPGLRPGGAEVEVRPFPE